ncbi:MAG: outer membrane protein assembly factor BamC [Limnohabitans sp.]
MKRLLISPSVTAVAVLLVVSGCSILEEDKVNYKSASQGPGLAVPPDLTQLRRDSRYALESTSATASGFASAQRTVKDSGTASNNLGDVRMERSGNQRWLVVNRPADKVWDTLREFWTTNGFTLTTDASDIGIMETDWAENRAKIPQDFIRRSLGKVSDGLYSSGERDRYRTRVERNGTGGVDIYVTHRGLIEEYADAQKTRTIWMPRASDPELEIEFLRRLMVKLGAPKEQVEQAQATGGSTTAATALKVVSVGGQPMLSLQDPLDRAWRRAGVALDRSGFTVEDRDRSKGIYFVRYVTPTASGEEPGFFSRLFSSKSQTPALTRYQIQLQSMASGGSQLRVLNQAGQAEASGNAEKILNLLATEMR